MKINHQQLKTTLFAVIVLALGTASQVWGANYKAIDLNPAGFSESFAYGVSGTQQVGSGTAMGKEHALLWNGSSTGYVDLTPSGWFVTYSKAICGTQQVGFGNQTTNYAYHALLWNGTAESYVDLHPSGLDESQASGTNGTQQVGRGYGSSTGGDEHALLWSGTAASCIDLNPSGWHSSQALANYGSQQVGLGKQTQSNEWNHHALLWNGTAESYVDLNPSGWDNSTAASICGTQQVGNVGLKDLSNWHAYLWFGSAESGIDLNPDGISRSMAEATNGTQQVGRGWGSATNFFQHAILWNGIASDYIDLHQFLPAGFTNSFADGIDNYGNIVGYAYDSSGNDHAILWQPIPEPATLLLLGLGAGIIRKFRS